MSVFITIVGLLIFIVWPTLVLRVMAVMVLSSLLWQLINH